MIFAAVFWMIGLGFFIQRFRSLTDETLTQLSGLVVEVFIPLYLFYTTAFQTDLQSFSQAPVIVLAGVVVSLGNFLLGGLVLRPFRVPEIQQPAFRFSFLFTNTLFIAAPICLVLYGAPGILYAVLFDFGANLVILSLGVGSLRQGHKVEWRSLVRGIIASPLIWAIVAGLLVALSGWKFPEWLTKCFELVGQLPLPLALFIGGAFLGGIRDFQSNSWRQLLGFTVVRLIIAPLAAGIILLFSGWQGIAAGVIFIETAMPTGFMASVFARNYQADAQFVASATFVTTFVSMATLPFVAWLANYWF